MSWVYFLRPIGLSGPVKIGWSTMPARRLFEYLQWSPWPLEIAHALEGDAALERRFHQLLIAHHSHHEWFSAAPEVVAVVEALQAGTFDLDALPAPRRITHPRRRTAYSPERRQYLSLSTRVRHVLGRMGFMPTPEGDRALNFLDSDKAQSPLREAAVATIEAFLADPLNAGRLMQADWAIERFRQWAGTNGVDPAPYLGKAA